ncbi:type II secretion system protein J [Noviherbaspirillum sp. UKPF54]|uniref:PulJ/GspJ family protein n=1 Tax=Noviherbaspirillum sp. UKPF54 TaxID=2601898 RepID=UPI0011B13D6F|nr:prepilin-type N-terminal cleavage/methylation domain-containing protein [Noviherbaspirillum sp. UKPF54]QDZ29148.1 prepilin-type N-terminal cleavage/methylation domain-containing protein [Noviherbaspirillum sp. UKPF54]
MASRQNRGFTLVELLVAITVMAIVAVLGWRGLDTIVRARVALTQDLEQTRGIQLAFAQMQSDCAHIVQPSNIAGHATLLTGPQRVTMVRTVFAENQPSRVQVVVYRLRDGKLSRYESPATRDLTELDSMWQAAIDETNAAPGILLQSDVGQMSIDSLFRNSSGSGVSNTPPAATPQGNVAMPVGLQVVLQLNGHETGMTKIFLLGAV